MLGSVMVNMPALHARGLWFDPSFGQGNALLMSPNNSETSLVLPIWCELTEESCADRWSVQKIVEWK